MTRRDRRRPLRGPLRAVLTICVPLALAGLQPEAAQAQTTTLVGNTGQSSSFQLNFFSKYAQPFTTGSAPGGYNIDSVTVEFAELTSGEPAVSIWSSDARGLPDNLLFAVTHRAAVGDVDENSGAGLYEWSAPNGSKLDPRTTYHVVVDHVKKSRRELATTNSRSVDGGSASGWKIPSKSSGQQTDGSWARLTSVSGYMQFQIKGQEVPDLPTVTVTPATTPVPEGTAATFTVTRTVVTEGALTVRYGVSETGGDRVAAADEGAKTVDFSGDATSVTVTVPVEADDGVKETDSAVTLTLTPDAAYELELGGRNEAKVAVEENDGPPKMTLVLSPDAISENGGSVTVTATLDYAVPNHTVFWIEARPVRPARTRDYTLEQRRFGLVIGAYETELHAELPENVATITAVDDNDYRGDRTLRVSARLSRYNKSTVLAPDVVEVTIQEDENPIPTVELVPETSTVAEGVAPTFTVTRLYDVAGELTLKYSVSETGHDRVAADEEGEKTIVFEAGETRKTVTVPVAPGNAADERDSTVTVALTEDPTWVLGARSSAWVTIEDDDPPPTVTVASDGDVDEGGGPVAFTLTRTGGTDLELTVNYRISATGRFGVAKGAGAATFEIGASTASVSRAVANDGVEEKDGSATLTLLEDTSVEPVYLLGAARTATATIRDDDGPPVVTLVLSSDRIAEDGGAGGRVEVTAELDKPATRDVTLTVSATPVSPTVAGDFALGSPLERLLGIPAGDTTSDRLNLVHVTAVDNDVYTGDRTLTVSATVANSNRAGVVPPEDVTLTIVEDEEPPLPSAPGHDYPTTGTVTVAGAPTEGETLTADASGLADADGLTAATYAWQWIRTPSGGGDGDIAGATSPTYVPVFADAGATLKVRVTVIDDEGHEAILTSAPTPPAAALPRPSVTVASGGDVTEGGPASFTLTRTGATTETLEVAYAVTATGAFGVATGADTAIFPAGGATTRVDVATTGDGVHEAHGSVTLTLTADTSAAPAWLLGDPSAATAAVRDDDNAAPTGAVTIDDTTPAIGETLTANPSGVDDPDGLADRTFTYRWIRVSDGTETPIGGATAASYAVVDADAGAALKVELGFVDDDGTAERIESPATAAVAAPALPTVSVLPETTLVREGDPATFTVTRTGVTTGALTVRYRVSETGGDRVAASDEGAKTIDFSGNATSVTVTVPVEADDGAEEADSAVTVTLTADAAAYRLGALVSAEVTVADDDLVGNIDGAAGSVLADDIGTFAQPFVTGAGDRGYRLHRVVLHFNCTDNEKRPIDRGGLKVTLRADGSGGTPGGVLHTLSNPSSLRHVGENAFTAPADVVLAPGTRYHVAVAYSSYRPSAPEWSLSGASTAAAGWSVPDSRYEVYSSGTVVRSAGRFAIAIKATEIPPPVLPLVEVAAGPTPVTEATGRATFTVTRSGVTTGDLTVKYHVAERGGDMVSAANEGGKTISFSGDETSVTVTVPLEDDDEVEPYSEIFVILAPDAAYDLDAMPARRAALVWARDDDCAAPKLSLALTRDVISENGGRTEVTATLNCSLSDPTYFDLVVTPVSPATSADFTIAGPTSGEGMRIRSGETKSARTSQFRGFIEAVDNDAAAGPKTFKVAARLTENRGGVAAPDPVTLTISDDEGPEVTITGRAREGLTLTAHVTGVAADPAVTYQWFRTRGGGSVDIPGATGAAYTVVAADAGATLRVRATVTRDGGETTVASASTAPAAPLPELAVADASGNEWRPSGTLSFKVTLTPASPETVTVNWKTSDDTATAGADYEAARGSLTFDPGETAKEVAVRLKSDYVGEADERFFVNLSDPARARIEDGQGVGTILNDDWPQVRFSAFGGEVVEGAAGSLDVVLPRASSADTVVTLSFTPVAPAVAGDLVVTNGVVTIPAGRLQATERVFYRAVNNDADTPDKKFIVSATVRNDTESVRPPERRTLTILDDDTDPKVTLTLTPNTILENGGTATVNATLNRRLRLPTEITVSVTPIGSATADDYVLSETRRIRILGGLTSTTSTAPTITAVDNGVDAPNKKFKVSAKKVRYVGNDLTVLPPDPVILTVADDDGAPTLSIADATLIEGDAGHRPMPFTVTLSPPASETVTVDWAASDGTAKRSEDYGGLSPSSYRGTLAFAPGDVRKTILVPVYGDNMAEADETFTVTLSNAAGAGIEDASATGTIVEDDLTTVTVAPVAAEVTEGRPARFTLTRIGYVGGTLDVRYDVTATGDFGVAPSSGTAAFPAGDATVEVSLDTADDGVNETHGSVTLALKDDPAYFLWTDDRATVAVADDDDAAPTGAPTIAAETTFAEGETLTASVSGIADADGLTGAVYGYQWVRTPSGGGDETVPGATGAAYVPTFADAGGTLKVRVTFTDDGGHAQTLTSAATPVIAALPRPEVTVVSDGDVTEGETVTFTLTRTGAATEPLDVTYVTGATPVAGDYGVTPSSGTATFPAGDATVRVSVPTTGDDVHEAHGSVILALMEDSAADPAYVLGDPAAAAAAVKDDDDSPTTGTVSILVSTTVTEGDVLLASWSVADADGLNGATYGFQWVRTPPGGDDENVPGATDVGYVPTFADVGATLKFKVTVTDDEGHEAALTSAPTPAVRAAPRPSVTVVSDGDVTEGDAVTFTLRRTGDPAEPLDVPYETTAAGDFGVTPSSGTATFPENGATVQVSVATTGDDVHEPHGSATLTLTADTSADPAYVLGDPAAATAAVEDDDDSPATGTVTVTGTPAEGETLTADASGIADADGLDNATYAWQWVRMPDGGVDAAVAGATSRTYAPVFADAGATLKVKVTVTDDEGHEAAFTSAPTAAVTARARPSVTVASDDAVTEGGTVTFTLSRTGDAAERLEVPYETTASGEFGAATGAGTATFPANGSTTQVTVATTGDDVHEAHGSVTLSLAEDTSANPAWLLGDPAAATTAVKDDDDSPATGTVTVTGTPTEGAPLTADASGLVDADGLTGATYAWQWVRTPDGGVDADVAGATSRTYVPTFADVGATLKVKVTVTDDEGHDASFTSAPTAAVLPPIPVVTVTSDDAVTEGGTVVFTLSRTGDTAERLVVPYETTASGEFGAATGAGTATFPANDATARVTVATTGDDLHEPHGSVTLTLTEDTGADPAWLLGDPAAATTAVKDDDDSPATGTVTVTGTPTEGETLTADASGLVDADGLTGATYAWQWTRTPDGGVDADVAGATSRTYVPVFADAGATLKVKVTVTDDEGHEAAFTSAPTSAVAALPRPEVTVAEPAAVTEGDTVTFTLTRTGDAAERLDVSYETTASGEFGAATGSGTATFPANDSTTQVTVTTTGDDVHEAHGSVTLTLTEDTGADPAWLLGDPAAATAAVRDDDNAAPTGALTIAGTPTEGETLTADASGIGDPDGLTSPSFTWRWIRTSDGTETEIAGATAATYTVVADDVGSTLKARASFVDDDGNPETVESAATATVEAAPLPMVTVAPDTTPVAEGTAATFTVTRTVVTTGSLTVRYGVSETGGDRVTAANEGAKTISFSGDETSVTVTVPTEADSAEEADSVVTVTLTAGPAYELGERTTGAVTVEDDPPKLTLVLSRDAIDEAGGSVTVTATLNRAVPNSTTFFIEVTPVEPAEKRDYRLRQRIHGLLIDANQTELSTRVVGNFATITAVDNDVDQSDKTLRVSARMAERNRSEVLAPDVVEVTIREDDVPLPVATLVLSSDTIAEDGGAGGRVEVTAELDKPVTAPLTLVVSAAPVSPTVAGDFALGPREPHVLAIPAGDTTSDRLNLVHVTAVDNAAYTGDRTLTVSAWVAGSDPGVVPPEDVTLTIVEDDDPPSLSVADAPPVDEGDTDTATATFTVTLSPAAEIPVMVDWETSDGTGTNRATAGTDYTASRGTLTFAVGDATRTFTVPVAGDTEDEPDEKFTVTLTNPRHATLAKATAEGTIANDDHDSATTGTVTVTGTPAEGGTLTADTSGLADADGLTGATYAWQWVRTPDGGVDADIVGATSRTYVPVFADVGATLKVKVTVTDDEGHETTLTSAPTAAVAARARPSVTVTSDDAVTEGETVTFTLTRTGAATEPLNVPYETTASGDFGVATGAGTAAFPANDSTVRVTVTTTGDDVHEAHGSVTLTLTEDTGADPAWLLGDPAAATAAVEDDDNAAPTGAPTITGAPTEGETLTADASGVGDPDGLTNRAFTYQWIRVASGGGSGTRIAGAIAASYTVAAEDVGATLKVEVGFTDDDGNAETVESAATAEVGAAPLPTVTVAPGTTPVIEGASATFMVTRTGVTTGELTVRYDVSETGDMVASDEEDAQTVAFSGDVTTVTVTVPTAGDVAHEADSVVTVTLTPDAAYVVGPDDAANVTVEDDDNAASTGAPTITGAPTEGETLTADASGVGDPDGLTNRAFTYQWIRVASGGGSETRIAGATAASYTVTAADVGAALKVEVGFTDDDGATETVESAATAEVGAAPVGPVLSIAPPEVDEGDASGDGVRLTFRLELSRAADSDVTIDYRVDTGASTATAGVDYRNKSGSKTIKRGRTDGVVKIGIVEDVQFEPDETVVMVFENPRGVALDPGSRRVTGTIRNDDAPPVTSSSRAAGTWVAVAAESVSVTEGEDAVFVLSRTGDASAPLTVPVDVSQVGSVLAGTVPTEATFGEDETTARLRVATDDDSTPEADGRVTARVIAGGSAAVDVFDDDAPAAPGGTATLWSTTMTVANLGGSVGVSGSDLAEPGWSEEGVAYALDRLQWFGSPKDRVRVRFNRRPSSAGELTLHAGALSLPLDGAGTGRVFRWLRVAGDPWSAGEKVALRLTRSVAGAGHDGAADGGVSVADARVNESAGKPLAFRVELAEARPSAVSVRYATSDGSAKAGADYVAASGMVRFEPGETTKTVNVAVLEDSHDEGEETLTLALSRPFGATVADGVATGTIVNTDAMPQAWLARFGRTVAGQVIGAVETRMTAARQAGTEVSVAGRAVGAAESLAEAASRDAGAAGRFGDEPDPETRMMSGSELLAGTSFALTGGTAKGGFVSLWGQGVTTGFDGRDRDLSVDGDVMTGLLGADWARAGWAAGVIVGHSRGDGDYGGQGAGKVSSSLTGVYPWGRQALNDRVTVWGLAGYGQGTLTLEPEGQARIETDMYLRMAAAGLRGVLVKAPAKGGLELAAKTDGLILESASDAARGGDGGMLAAASADVTRLRLGLEGTRTFLVENGRTLTPSLEIAARHDGGDAETGFGVDMGAGLAYADPSSGVTADVRGRGLLTHEASGFRELGFSGSLAFDPTPSSGRGLSLSLGQTLGASATGGSDALYGSDAMPELATEDGAGPVGLLDRRRFEARIGYGLSAFGSGFTATPEFTFGHSESDRDYSLGWRLTPEGRASGAFEFGLKATRREAATTGNASEHGVGLQATMRW